MRQTGVWTRGCRNIVGLVLLFGALFAVVPMVEAQQLTVPTEAQYDRIRVSGFLWRRRNTIASASPVFSGAPGSAASSASAAAICRASV